MLQRNYVVRFYPEWNLQRYVKERKIQDIYVYLTTVQQIAEVFSSGRNCMH